ncbi:MAG: quinone oxidoreductase [Proteobacteria bacterium]|nr:quinone oxidoreductase [Pseudomonadota bacterium]MCL2307577.1 quinone oxidoreductase [Pseudomonadota bacterium]
MFHAIKLYQTGGPETMRFEEVTLAELGPGEVRVRHTAIGVNYIDVYLRNGLYPQPLPGTLGKEAAGIVEAVGSGVTDVKVGDRVAYCNGPLGAYSEARVIPAEFLVRLPDGIDDADAAAAMLKGLTVQYLFRQTYRLREGETFLFHAAAGGVGLIACQWARALGARMIGTVGSDEKAALAKEHGCEHVINYRKENFVERVKELTDGKGVDVVYDSVGRDTFPSSLDCLKPRGLWVSYGNSSGAVPPFEIGVLSQKGSLFATRPTLFSYADTRPALLTMSEELFALMQSGKIRTTPRHRFALKDAADAHRLLESRGTSGATVLIP